MKKLTAFVLSAMMVLSLAACGSSKTETPAEDTSTPAEDTAPAEDAKLTYAVEAGSAGEEVALANGYDVVSVDSQAKALMEVGGAKEIYACSTHGVLSGPAYDRIEASPIKEMVFLNTIPEVANTPSHKIKFLDVAPVFARAIGHIHGATSIADLF